MLLALHEEIISRLDPLSGSGFQLILPDPLRSALNPPPTGSAFDQIQPKASLLIAIQPWVPRLALGLLWFNQDPVSGSQSNLEYFGWLHQEILCAPDPLNLFDLPRSISLSQLALVLPWSIPELATWSWSVLRLDLALVWSEPKLAPRPTLKLFIDSSF